MMMQNVIVVYINIKYQYFSIADQLSVVHKVYYILKKFRVVTRRET